MMSYMDKRVDERAYLNTFAKFKILSDNEQTVSHGFEEGATRNISKSGLCIQVPRKLEDGSVIRIEIPSFDEVDRSIKAFCEVQWCVKNTNNDNFEAGLSFIALKEEDVEYLHKLVEKQNKVK